MHRQAPDETKPLVLVVADTPDLGSVLRAKLGQEWLKLESSEGAEDGVQRARANPPAVIILDFDMPGVDGAGLIRGLKSDPVTQDSLIIVLSVRAASDEKAAAFELGAVDYVAKPFEFAELRARLRSALKTHELLRLLSQRAQVDGLTGLWNRAYFDHRWAQEHARVQRQGHELSLAIFDIDHFKQVNDRYGHPAGDEVLVGLAKILRQESRRADSACRYGGEEFVLIMPDTDFQSAGTVCERVRAAVERSAWAGVQGLKVTVSAGYVSAGGFAPGSSEDWLHKADRHLYEAKHSGRNRCVGSPMPKAANRLAG